jgi:hypothetical protein
MLVVVNYAFMFVLSTLVSYRTFCFYVRISCEFIIVAFAPMLDKNFVLLTLLLRSDMLCSCAHTYTSKLKLVDLLNVVSN